ncbi:hypothetical protein SAMN05216356_11745 [Oribacterium sp. WCC10]|nr:hypothetical protein SAMN05216356_11745 [Oribacterium sp. WCC10]
MITGMVLNESHLFYAVKGNISITLLSLDYEIEEMR